MKVAVHSVAGHGYTEKRIAKSRKILAWTLEPQAVRKVWLLI